MKHAFSIYEASRLLGQPVSVLKIAIQREFLMAFDLDGLVISRTALLEYCINFGLSTRWAAVNGERTGQEG